MNNALFFMCLMGSLVYLCYLLLCKIFRQRFLPRQRFAMLFAAACLYLVPTPLIFPPLVKELLQTLDNHTGIYLQNPYSSRYHSGSKAILVTPDGKAHLPDYSMLFWVCFIIWVVLIVVFLTWEYKKYRKYVTLWMKNSNPFPYPVQEKKRHCFRQPVQIRVMSGDFTPFTIGYFKPVIIIPENWKDHSNLELVFRHEMCHIRHSDTFIKIIGLLAMTLHWYCPVSYFLYISLGNTLELLCDKQVLTNLDPDQKNEYVNLLLQTPSQKQNKLISAVLPYSSFQSFSFRLTKERILMIKHHGNKTSLITAVLAVLSVILSVTPVLAYQPAAKIDSAKPPSYDAKSEYFFVPEGEDPPAAFLEAESEKLYFDIADSYFISEDGTLYIITSDSSAYNTCNHILQTGYYFSHNSNLDGSCDFEKYFCDCCPKCNYVTGKVLSYNCHTVVCSH